MDLGTLSNHSLTLCLGKAQNFREISRPSLSTPFFERFRKNNPTGMRNSKWGFVSSIESINREWLMLEISFFYFWLVVSTHLKNASQIGSSPQFSG